MSLEQEISAVVVTYNTHRILMRSVLSVKKKYPRLNILIVDNSRDGNQKFTGCPVIHTYKNIGHGPGMDRGIKEVSAPKVLLFDSDIVLVRGGVLERMLEKFDDRTFGVGQVLQVNERGQNGINIEPEDKTLNYLHPYFMVIDREKYLQLPPFIHHGAPCLKTMQAIRQTNFKLVDFMVKRFVHHTGRATRRMAPKEFNSKNWEKV